MRKKSTFWKLISTRNCAAEKLSVGSFLQQGLDAYWGFQKVEEELKGYGNWSRKSLEEGSLFMKIPRGLIHKLVIRFNLIKMQKASTGCFQVKKSPFPKVFFFFF